jgi:hypothetical protein
MANPKPNRSFIISLEMELYSTRLKFIFEKRENTWALGLKIPRNTSFMIPKWFCENYRLKTARDKNAAKRQLMESSRREKPIDFSMLKLRK